MADEKKPHPLALGGKRPEPTRKGRPKKQGDRFPNGRLKPPGPNERVVAMRKAICDDVTMATCPLDAAFARGWISQAEHGAGKAFIALHSGAGFKGPGYSGQRDTSLPTGSADELADNWRGMSTGQVLSIKWATLSSKEIVAIWDSALRDLGRYADPESAEQFAADANRKWRLVNHQLTAAQRNAVDAFCIREIWPQWMTERLAGKDSGRWGDQRNMLIEGLRVIGHTLRKPKSSAVVDVVQSPEPASERRVRRVERTVYVDAAGAQVLEVERITRDPAA